MTAYKRNLQRQIHATCRELGIDNDTRQALQLTATGKASMTEMNEADLRVVLKKLKGGRSENGKRKGRGLADRADVRLIHVMWKALGEAGVLKDPSRNGLNKFVRARFGTAWGAETADVDMLTDKGQIDTVLAALRDWLRKENVDFDFARGGR